MTTNLIINGWTIPIEKAGMTPMEIGEQKRAFSGRQRRVRLANSRGIRRDWNLNTKPMSWDDARALEGMLLALGDYWPFDADLYSAKGNWSLSATTNALLVNQYKYGGAALWCVGSGSNLLTSNQATGTDTSSSTTGFSKATGLTYNNTTGTGATAISSSTTQAWQGTHSLKLVSSAGGLRAMRTSDVTISANTSYVFSVYLRSVSGSASVVLAAVDQTSATLATSATVAITATGWTRATLAFTTGGSSSVMQLFVQEATDSAFSWYADGWLVNTGSVPVAWVDGAYTGMNLTYDASRAIYNHCNAVTFNAWVALATGGTIMALSNSGNSAKLRWGISSGHFLLDISNAGGTSTYSNSSVGSITATGWDMVTLVVYPTAPTGQANYNAYYNGVLVASVNALCPDLTGYDTLHIGNYGGTQQLGPNGYLDEAIFAVYPWTQALISAVRGATLPFGAQPQLTCSGDFMQGITTTVVAHDVSANIQELGSASGSWQNNMGRVQFSLTEV